MMTTITITIENCYKKITMNFSTIVRGEKC